MTTFVKSVAYSVKSLFGSEAYIHDLLIKDPSLLNLGDLLPLGKERRQSSSGRLDLLFESADEKRWYEVEVQLGATDETHIIRTIEYWDLERRHRPKVSHTAVIVAEEITQRFFNVIALFNQHVPIIAIKMTALDVGGQKTIVFTKILNYAVVAEGPEDPVYQPTDRAYWVKQSSESSMNVADQILLFAGERDASVEFKYNKGYIKTLVGGELSNFMTLRPKKKAVRVSLSSPRTPETDQSILDEGFELEYEDAWGKYIVWISEGEFEPHKSFLRKLVHQAYDVAELGLSPVVET